MSTPSVLRMNPTKKLMTSGIMLALIVWGIYLAIGATGMFVQEDMMDARKSGIVILCVGMFLGLWGLVLLGVKRKNESAADPGEIVDAPTKASSSKPNWSRAGIATFALLSVGAITWCAAVLTWQRISLGGTTVLGWLAALCIMGSATAAIITLSQRSKLRGKWLALFGLVGFAASLFVFVVRMSP